MEDETDAGVFRGLRMVSSATIIMRKKEGDVYIYKYVYIHIYLYIYVFFYNMYMYVYMYIS